MKKKLDITPLNNRVIIKVDEAKKETKTGIIIADTAQTQPNTGIVIAVGQGFPDMPMQFKEGQRIVFEHSAGIPITMNGVEYLIIREQTDGIVILNDDKIIVG